MLVLTRRIGEEIIINGNIRVAITNIVGDNVKIGIAAPKDVPIDRKEIHDRRRETDGGGPTGQHGD
jgi:carbon storage regulator